MNVYTKMKGLGLTLPPAPKNCGIFMGSKSICDNMLYVSGCGSKIGDNGVFGKVGRDVSMEEAQNGAAITIKNFLAIVEKELGDLNRVISFVKLLVFVSSDPQFYEQPEVANGATKLLVDLFGEKIGCPSRSAIGVAVLPGNISVEIEGIVKFK
jgi:enamine deaminase RidA (YjgF/YER057c/UK114 family)